MNWDAISAVAEILGVVLIVGSMIYVARQLSQTNTMMRVKAASERLERDYDIVEPIIESRELAEIWLKGESEFESLGRADQQRLLFLERRAIMLWHHQYLLRQQGLMPDASWCETLWIIKAFGRRQVIREAWQMFGEGFEVEFQEFINELFASADSENQENENLRGQ
jgi:hypothetical protein